MKSNFIIPIVAILLSATAIVVFFKSDVVRPSSKGKSENSEQITDDRTTFWEIYPELVITTEGQSFNDQVKILDTQQNQIPIIDVLRNVKHRNILVFRFSNYDCDLCIKKTLPILINYIKKNPENIKIIVDGMTERNFRIKFKDIQDSFTKNNSVLFLKEQNFNFPLENKNIPFFFLLDNIERKISRVFIPSKSYPQQTITYLKNITGLLNE
ncbi:hypothetical protein I6I98_08730 [Sphingobacterium multivorum]|uniref:Redoxin domain-containing protein n=1 Tax=Sphingobacterium multivorum TaxID=28454 RepID=A0ABX7CTA5_SPHMU|nr:hypothetical protein [Sphingobacterium multivorum]QQT55322.1 hypothetical protein I6I98_08730 [Sphingobacterium multivorum]